MAQTPYPGNVTDSHMVEFSYTSTVTAYKVGYPFRITGNASISGIIQELPTEANDYTMVLWSGGVFLTNVAGLGATGSNSVAIGDKLKIYTGDISVLGKDTGTETVAIALGVVTAGSTATRIKVWLKGGV